MIANWSRILGKDVGAEDRLELASGDACTHCE